ncbi:MAG: BatA and WFA domain-containing protein [Pirellulaceae bacterium]|nr:BatA and WFA domain-containing protein [Pirellulaceae bacterium]
MALLHSSLLLFGSLAVIIPLVLHFLMRKQPKVLTFPALQFLQKTKVNYSQRMQVRHWLLLLLRMLLILILAAALARIRTDSILWGDWLFVGILAGLVLVCGVCLLLVWHLQKIPALRWVLLGLTILLLGITLLKGWETASKGSNKLEQARAVPVAAALVFDTSPRMGYQSANETRLQRGQVLGREILAKLPPESAVAILEPRDEPALFSPDRSAAGRTIDRLRPYPAATDLSLTISEAVRALKDQPQAVKEIYLFSDMTEGAWGDHEDRFWKQELAEEGIHLYILDVGEENPQDIKLEKVELFTEQLSQGDPLKIQATVTSVAKEATFAIELYLESTDPTYPFVEDDLLKRPPPVLKSRQEITLAAGQKKIIDLSPVTIHELGEHHGFLKVTAADGLAWDNVSFFSFVVNEPWPVLLVAPDDVSTTFMERVLVPDSRSRRFQTTKIDQARLLDHSLSAYRGVLMVDPVGLDETQWQLLHDYLESGGQVVLFLGRNATRESFNSPAAQQLLPAKLDMKRKLVEPIYLVPQMAEQKMFAPLLPYAGSFHWQDFPVWNHWQMVEPNEQTRILIRFSDGRPALVERPVGEGNLLLWTTPISETNKIAFSRRWNEFATSLGPGVFVLLNEMMRYQIQESRESLQSFLLQPLTLANLADKYPQQYTHFFPDGTTAQVTAEEERLLISSFDQPGIHYLKGSFDGPFRRGFSLNYPSYASNLTRLTPEERKSLIASDYITEVKSVQSLERVVDTVRQGKEFYPFFAGLLPLFLALEYLMGAFFYARWKGVT